MIARTGLRLAQAAVLAAALGGCAWLGGERELSGEIDLPEGVFQQALEKFQSGRTLSWQNDSGQISGTITPVRSFRLTDGSYCRQYDANYVDSAEGFLDWSGVACRDGDRIWRQIDGDRLS